MVDSRIVNCKLVTPEAVVNAGIAINNGKISAIANEANLPPADETIDAKGNFVIPGVIDPHVHLAATVPASKYEAHLEQFGKDAWSSSESAAIGGVTTYGHFIYSGPNGSNLKIFESFSNSVEENAMMDIFFHATVASDEQISEIPQLAEKGVTSFKFMFNAYKGPDGVFADLRGVEDGQLFAGLQKIGQIRDEGYPGAVLMIHAENQDLIYKFRKKLLEEGRDDLLAWSEHRPPICEEECLSRAVYIVKAVKLLRRPPMLYVCHVSSGGSVDVIANAKKEVEITAETCPPWLLLNKNMKELGPRGKVNPPLRDIDDNEKLWMAINKGVIDVIGTDHIASLPLKEKDKSIWEAYPGFPGEGHVPLLLSEGVNKGRISFEKFVELCCRNPARTFGIFPKKGSISVGSDADLVIVNMKLEKKVTLEALHSSAGFSVFDGWNLKGWPILTMLRGNIIMKEGEVTGKRGTGKYIPRTRAA